MRRAKELRAFALEQYVAEKVRQKTLRSSTLDFSKISEDSREVQRSAPLHI